MQPHRHKGTNKEFTTNMDSCLLTASDRHENKPSKRQISSAGQDIISNLPIFIIAHILSFLPIEDAVRTSVLSRRWIYMWTSVTRLYFGDKPIYKIKKTRFMNFVCRVLFHLNSASIDSFSFYLSERYDPYIISQWISVVSNRRVKKIHLRSLEECNISVYPIFKCQTLEELVLALGHSIVQFPSFVCLSSLTVLHLIAIRTGMTITCYSSNESKELRLNFPVLREYVTNACTWLGVKCVTLEAPLLEVLTMIRGNRYSRSDLSHAEIKIHASNIKKFRYDGYVSAETILLDAHVVKADISLITSKVKSVQQMGIFVRKLFSINNVECLRLYLYLNPAPYAFLDPAQMKHCLADIPAFGMLRHLRLLFVNCEVLLGLLLKSPRLETLVLKDLKVIKSDEEPLNFAIVPDCFLSTLKEVQFEDFAGGRHELSFAKFVMEKGQVLESISFSCYHGLRGAEFEKLKEEIFLAKRSFTIEFSGNLVTEDI